MRENARTAIIAINFIFFFLIVAKASNYLIGIVPAPQTQLIDLYTLVHGVGVGGTAFFILISTRNNIRLRNYALYGLFALVFVWEIIENTIMRETPLAGQESLANIGTDILIGIVSIGIVLSADNSFFSLKPKKRNPASKINPSQRT